MKNEIIKILEENEDKIDIKKIPSQITDENELAELLKKIGYSSSKSKKRQEINNYLKTDYIGKEIYLFKEVLSTNNVAKFFAEHGTDEGAVIISETQSKGKGSRRRKWKSPKGGTWLTIVLRPEFSPSKAPLITLATGIAVARTLRKYGVDAQIKWPNDILINNKKVSGILTEANAKFATLDYVVVGVGIDSNIDPKEFPELDKYEITSLKDELGSAVNENKLIANFLNEFELVYNDLKDKKFKDLLFEWRSLAHTIGNYVEVHQPLGKTLKGYAIGINKKGALIIELNNGELKKILSGEVINRDKP
jgi:BirA family biotin operon repressor/biotin-[acetyl-CoA-carboxylase] ligase